MIPPSAVQADLIVDVVRAVPGVVGLHGGVRDEVGVHLPGRRVTGVRLRPDFTEVHIVVAPDVPVHATVRAVQHAVADVRPGRVDVIAEDVGLDSGSVPREPGR